MRYFTFFIFSLLSYPMVGQTEEAKHYALFFAVEDYDAFRKLNNPIKNAEEIAAVLEAQYDFTTEVVSNPALDEIDAKLKAYQEGFEAGTYEQESQLLIFFSGHGLRENRNGYFLPKDANPEKVYNTGLGYEYWREYINKIDCKHIMVMIDACFSGTFDPDWWSRSGKNFARPGELSEAESLLLEHKKYKTRIFFTSATEVESPDRSRFAYRILEGLRSGGGTDGILTSSELFVYLERARPIPHRGEFGDDDPGSSFIFINNKPKESITASKAGIEGDVEAWKKARTQNDLAAYETYLDQFPEGEFVFLAKENIKELEEVQEAFRENIAWQEARISKTIEGYKKFLQDYPDGENSREAKLIIKKMELESKGVKLTNVTDPEGHKYGIMIYKGLYWTTSNLNFKVQDSWCYDDKSDNCNAYGRLYTWKAAQEACAKLGDGWRLPTGEEWKQLAKYYGGIESESLDYGRSAYLSLSALGTDRFGALMGGRRYVDGEYFNKKKYGYYWSSNDYSTLNAWYLFFNGKKDRLSVEYGLKDVGRSCRCVMEY